MLRDAKEFQQAQKDNSETFLSINAKEFIEKSDKEENNKKLKQIRQFLIFPFIGTLIVIPIIINLVNFIMDSQKLDRAKAIMQSKKCNPDPDIKELLEYMHRTKKTDNLDNLNLCGEQLLGINLSGGVVTNSDFTTSNLSNADFKNAILSGSHFKGVGAIYSDFSGASINKADFGCTEKLKCSLLKEAKFNASKLIGSKFQGAILTNTSFNNADLTDANFENAKNLTSQQLEGAILCNTKLPNYLKNVSSNRNCKKS